MRLNISAPAYKAMLTAAQHRAPCEACGMLAGREGNVFRFFELTNADASPEHFRMIPEEQFAAARAIRNEGLQLLGIWHSHPATPARMSKEDLRLAYTPEIAYVIVSLASPLKPEIRGFTVEGDCSREIELTIFRPPDRANQEDDCHD